MAMSRRIPALAVTLAMVALPVFAEVSLQRSTPEAGSVQALKLAEVRLWFGTVLAPGSVVIDVFDECGNQVDMRDPAVERADRRQARIGVEPTNSGIYEVHWKVTAEDKSETKGSFKFQVAQ